MMFFANASEASFYNMYNLVLKPYVVGVLTNLLNSLRISFYHNFLLMLLELCFCNICITNRCICDIYLM